MTTSFSLPPSLTWRVGYECVVQHRIQRWHDWQWLCEPCVCDWEAQYGTQGILPESSHMKLVGRFVTAAAFREPAVVYISLPPKYKMGHARNEPLHFLTTASQTDVSAVCSQMFPSTTMLLEVVLCLIRNEQETLTWMLSISLVEGCVHSVINSRNWEPHSFPCYCPRVYSLTSASLLLC